MRRAVDDQVNPFWETVLDFLCITDRRLGVETATDKEHGHSRPNR